jgi:hypothetical protein
VRGRLVCTLHNPTVRERSLTGDVVTLGTFDLPSAGGSVEVSAQGTLDRRTGIAESAQTYRIRDARGKMRAQRMQTVRFSLIGYQDFGEMAHASGFVASDVYGDYERSPFDAERSPYMIWMLEKAAAVPVGG